MYSPIYGGLSVKPKSTSGKVDIRLPLLSGLVLLLVLSFLAISFKASNPDLENRARNMVKMEETLSRMRIGLIKSVDIEKGAVMADTDELSRALADESLRTAAAVEQDRLTLSGLIEHDRIQKEMDLLHEFDDCWAELQKIDKVLLDFAVENSNIKASTLSFTQGSEAMSRFKQSLTKLIELNATTPQYAQVLKLGSLALTAGFEVLYLHAPHIAASNDKDMDRIEAEIAQLDEVIHSSLEDMRRFLPEENHAILQQAVSAYKDFERVTASVIRLSRQNTNIKSFELSLGRKRKVTAQCDEILSRMQEVIHSRTLEATR
jgi:hypothetical protein